MKRSTVWLIPGFMNLIVAVLFSIVVSTEIDFFVPMEQWTSIMWFFFGSVIFMLVCGIGAIVYSCILAIKEKNS